jgi:hypothetical protein
MTNIGGVLGSDWSDTKANGIDALGDITGTGKLNRVYEAFLLLRTNTPAVDTTGHGGRSIARRKRTSSCLLSTAFWARHSARAIAQSIAPPVTTPGRALFVRTCRPWRTDR